MPKTFGIQTANIVSERIMLVKKYKAFGFHEKEVVDILAADHNIVVTQSTVHHDYNEINSGKWAESYLDLLLDVNYPEMYEQTLQIMHSNLQELKNLSDTTENPQLKAKILISHTKLHMNILEVMHKGAVIREMKRLSTKAKILVREVLQQDSMIKKRGELHSMKVKGDMLEKKIVEFDENLNQITDEINNTEPVTENDIMSNE